MMMIFSGDLRMPRSRMSSDYDDDFDDDTDDVSVGVG